MSEENDFKMSQGYDVIPPKPGKAYPILCGEWEHLKSQIGNITTSFGVYHTAGSLLLGASISTLIAILAGSFKAAEGAVPIPLIVACASVIVAGLVGGVCLYFAYESREVAKIKASDVIVQMNLIEKRFEQESVG